MEKKKKQERMDQARGKGAVYSILFFIFYLNIEVLLIIILMFNVAAQVKIYNFFLNIFLLIYLLYP